MSEEREDGGQAFPRRFIDGMSLRDWFAGLAMAATIASPPGKYEPFASAADAAGSAYRVADAMLAKRGAP